jgi:hypothetical protein
MRPRFCQRCGLRLSRHSRVACGTSTGDLGELRPPANHNSPRLRFRAQKLPGKGCEGRKTTGCKPAVSDSGLPARISRRSSTMWAESPLCGYRRQEPGQTAAVGRSRGCGRAFAWVRRGAHAGAAGRSRGCGRAFTRAESIPPAWVGSRSDQGRTVRDAARSRRAPTRSRLFGPRRRRLPRPWPRSRAPCHSGSTAVSTMNACFPPSQATCTNPTRRPSSKAPTQVSACLRSRSPHSVMRLSSSPKARACSPLTSASTTSNRTRTSTVTPSHPPKARRARSLRERSTI